MHLQQKSCFAMKSGGASSRHLTGLIPTTRLLLRDNLEIHQESALSGTWNGENNWGGSHILHYYRNYPKFSHRKVWANSADPDQTAPRGAV